MQKRWKANNSAIKSVLHNLHDESQTICQASDNQVNWYQSTSILQNICVDRNQDIFNFYYAHSRMTNSIDILKDTVFSPVESLQESFNSYTVTKCQFKLGNLQIFCYFSNETPNEDLWDTIPCHPEDGFIQSMNWLKIKITGSWNKYISQLLLHTFRI